MSLLLPWKASVKSEKFTGWLCKCNLTPTDTWSAEGSENMVILFHIFLPHFIFTNFVELWTKKKSEGQDIYLGIFNPLLLWSATWRLMIVSNSELSLLIAKSSKRKTLWSKANDAHHYFFWNAIFPVCHLFKNNP